PASTIPTLPLLSHFPYTTLFRSRESRRQDSIPTSTANGAFLCAWGSIGSAERSIRPAKRTILESADQLSSSHSLALASSGSPRKDRKSTRLNSSHEWISYAVFCL